MRAVWVAAGVVGVVVAALWMQRHVFSFGSSRLAVVTGANRGLGRAIGHELNLHFADIGTVLCARKIRDAEEASASASTPKRCAACELDLLSNESIASVVSQLQDVDILINNAGFATSGDAFDESIARTTIGTNFFQTRYFTYQMLPKMAKNGRIVTVTSTAGLINKYSAALQERFRNAKTDADLDALANEFIGAVADGTYAQKGWPKNTYSVSKALANFWVRNVLSKRDDVIEKQLHVSAVCPGWVQTRMTNFKGHKTPQQGAETPIWLATADLSEIGESGQFYVSKKPKEL